MDDSSHVSAPAEPTAETEHVARIRRWEAAGGVWRVLGGGDGEVTVGLYTCDAGEEMDRFTSEDQQLLAVVAERTASDA